MPTVEIRSTPHVLYLDIETSPNMAFLWSLKVPGGYVNSDMIVKDWFVISWAASWADEKKVYSGVVSSAEAKRWEDKKMLRPLWELIDSADIVVGHNSKKFDMKKLNTRFLLHGYGPPRRYRQLDTLTEARKYFAFESNKLEFINKRVGNLLKHEMKLEDWIHICLDGDQKTLDKMVRYNRGDVVEGKKLFHIFRDWIDPFPKQPKLGYKTVWL